MIKVIVVDDEPPILNVVATMIEETNSNFQVVGKALNGEDALPLIDALKPDVVFTDVKMPVMDGLALIEKLTAMDPSPVSVVLSGYKEFEFARNAFKYGAIDYLLKPLDLDGLQEILKKLYIKITQIKKNREVAALDKLMLNSSPILMSQKNLSPAIALFDFKKYICILFCAGSYCSYHSSLFTPGIEFWAKCNLDVLLPGKINKSECFWILDGEHGNEKIVLIGSNNNFTTTPNSLTSNISTMASMYDTPITTVVGEVFDNIEKFGNEVQQLQKALKKYITFGLPQLITKDLPVHSQTNIDGDIINPSWEAILKSLIVKKKKEIFRQNIKSLLNICEDKKCRQFILENVLQQVYRLFCDALELTSSDKIIDISMELYDLIVSSTNYKQLNESLLYLTDDLFSSLMSTNDDLVNSEEIFKSIDEYIKANYAESINLQTLSDLFGFVPPYLSRKYKMFKGLSPNDYILQLRIQKAKQLLLSDLTLSIKDIAKLVGYEDPYYMSRIFKVSTGKSPSEFRNSP